MKTVFMETKSNGVYDYVAKYFDTEKEALAAAEDLDRRISSFLVPDRWGIPGFEGWTEEEKATADTAGRFRLLPSGGKRKWSTEIDNYHD